MSQETTVKLPDDSANTGPKIRNLRVSVRVLNSDGTVSDETRLVQEVVVTDPDGNPVDLFGALGRIESLLKDIRTELIGQNNMYAEVNRHEVNNDVDRLRAEWACI